MFNNQALLTKYLEEAAAGNRIAVRKNYPLSRLSSFRIGGDAVFAVWPENVGELTALVALSSSLSVPTVIVGNGSNLLFDDLGYDGLVIVTTSMTGIRRDGDRLTAECGVPLTHLASVAGKAGLGGLSFAYGIPGTLGGAVFMNAGAYGSEIGNVIGRVDWFDPGTEEFGSFDGAENGFSYRFSRYQRENKLILSAELKLSPAEPEALQCEMEDYLSRRREKQPLDYPSAGSAFKRVPGRYTSQLIDEAGLKGATVGGAQVSEKHAGFIINRGGATAADVLALMKTVQDVLREKYQIEIEPEIRYIPCPGQKE